MKKEDRELLIRDLCARLPYGVKCNAILKQIDGSLKSIFGTFKGYNEWATVANNLVDIETVRPYLRPMSSMTREEWKEYESFIFTEHHEWDGHGTSTDYVETDDVERYITWLNKKGFDFRGLIPMGLALEAPEGMYKTV